VRWQIREIGEQESRCLDRIVPSGDSHDKRELCLYERRELGSLSEHAGVRRDETVPRVCVMVQGQQQLPIVECRHARVDPVEWNECGVGLEVRQDADDGLREVLIESEQARHMRALSCCQRRVQILCELALQVESVLDCRRLDVRVEPIDLGLRQATLGEGTERL
jgi:hypothetical protein